MKIKFIDKELYWEVKEEEDKYEEIGLIPSKVWNEKIGLIPKAEMCLKIDDDFSGILELDVIKQILNFMENAKK